jgi:hypothetical protein
MSTPKTKPEEFLHFVWENQLFISSHLKTVKNEPLEVLSVGYRNTNSGPDFFNAKVKIGGTLWAGNIEIHSKASDWEKHRHDADKAYENVILHVVEKADKQIFRKNGTAIETLELTWPEQFTKNYQDLQEARTWIACQNQFHRIDPLALRLGFNRMMVERLEEKTGEIALRLEKNQYDWNETFYQMLFRMFGFKVNAVPFELLSKSVPLKILLKHKNNLFQQEALLFGGSGLLQEELLGDDYFLKLREEFFFLGKKYGLKPVEGYIWKFMRLRPVNFPTIRISQLAALFHHHQGLFSKLMETRQLSGLKNFFKVKASAYWDSHYRFNKATLRRQPRELGENAINILIINVVVPFLFIYGEKQNLNHLKNRALEFLEQLPPENNSIIRNWDSLGVKARSAFESQALIWLKNSYCGRKRCLKCHIGNKLVKQSRTNSQG